MTKSFIFFYFISLKNLSYQGENGFQLNATKMCQAIAFYLIFCW